ncbi:MULTISPECIES: UDP-galactopyranose mutase [Enterobacteriaceae]|uniref:UDP-galactopyranose mutase n=1 Tax=Enterobacteriaceae TaxID=543 RepID=UPI0015F943F6|nr:MULTISPECIES: UDP-galactopyranose mutase [Enterobacteriaceae]EHK8451994.1 UDP-galactopyranose mutase [Escherichia coli]MCU3213562.1 UDP-galactopyranose mutase [Enterobacter hormaechei subsp. steigerwaltii]MBA7946739.1 UDP-galactopyranose mutase [Citrobacter freundii]MCU3369588.1 UDP-galactopyranose mutase [Enterobacter hormaechei subsp. steigerwaltii]MDK5879549.1 UDP-galactopyranose mutase [Citrobacter freundii]
MYDYLVVGAGLFGSTFARLATDAGKKCLIIDKRDHIAGNCYTEKTHGIHKHVFGPHIFHCNDEAIWDFVNRFAQFNNFVNRPIAINNGKAFSLPFSMYTFNAMWGVTTPEEAIEKIESQRLKLDREPLNLEEQALTLVGEDIYNTLIRDYTKKQWQKDPKELPPTIIKRLPVRMSWDNNYFYDKYQGIPIGGYTAMFENMLEGIEVKTNVDYFADKQYWDSLAEKVVFTGKIDEYYDFQHGELEYRSLKFETEIMPNSNYQGNAVVNYNSADVPWTRIIEHKHFDSNSAAEDVTVVTKEIPDTWSRDKTPYYPIGDDINMAIFKKYEDMAILETNVIFGGRLAEYRYYDMHQVIGSAFNKFKDELAATV